MKWILGLVTGNPWAIAAIAAALLAAGATGGWKVASWRAADQVAAAQRELSEYQAQASQVIIARLEENARLTIEDQARAIEISHQVEEGKREVQKRFEPVLEELSGLRVAASVWRLRDQQAAGGNSGAGEDLSSCQRRADALEERLRGARGAFAEVAAAAEEVARSGRDAGEQHRQLIGTIEQLEKVCQRPP